ncbi:MAG: TonB-dependent receptor [Pseudoxanthomonas sp.]
MSRTASRRAQALALMTVSALSLAIAQAHAQEQATQEPPAGNAARSATELDTVVVTATKREKALRDVPASITAISGDELEQRGVQNIEEITRLVPGVNISSPAGNAQRITIRGIAGEANTNPTTGILFGNTSFTDAYVPHVTMDPNPFDMQSVEVLKGPQGTLFGASALNGAVRYTPAQPVLGETSGKYYLQGGSVSEGSSVWGTGAALNLPVGNDAALRVVAFDRKLPGWVDDVVPGKKDANQGTQHGFRGILAVQPDDALDIRLTYAYQKTDRDDSASADNFDGILLQRTHALTSPSSQKYHLGNLSISYDLGAFRFVSETSAIYKRYHAVGESSGNLIPLSMIGNQPLVIGPGDEQSDTYSQEFRLVSNDGPDSDWSWIVGVFGSRQDIDQYGANQLGNPAIVIPVLNLLGPGLGNLWYALGQPDYSASYIDVRVQEVAAFFDLTRNLGNWELSAGGRLYKTKSGGTVLNNGLMMTVLGFPAGYVIDDTVEDSGFSPKLSVLWRASDNVNFYSTVSKGYRVGGVQWGTAGLTGLAPNTFKTDTIWNYELGMRSTWLDRTLSLDATAFYEKWKDPQVLVFPPGMPAAYVDNVGGVTSKGLEAALRYLFPIDGLSLGLSASYTDAKTTEAFTDSAGHLVPAGTRWPLSPKVQTAATLAYDRYAGNWHFGGSITNAYMSKAIYGINQASEVFGYPLTDVQLRLANTAWKTQPELSLTVSNIADKRGLSTAYAGGTFVGTPWYSGSYVQPRTVMLRLSGSF